MKHSVIRILAMVVMSGVVVAQTFFTEGFESFSSGYAFPQAGSGWTQNNTSPQWAVNTGTHHPSGYVAQEGNNVAWFNSWHVVSGNSWLISPVIDLSSAATDPTLEFWMFRDDGFSFSDDRLRVHLSTDGGTTWTQLADYPRYSAAGDYWEMKSITLTGTAGQSNVKIAFEGISDYGNDIQIDDIRVYAPMPMQYQDSWAEQLTGAAAAGEPDVPILAAVIETDGSLNPLTVDVLDFLLPTAALSAIDNVQLWYSGSIAEFNPLVATLLATIPNPGSNVSFSISQPLQQGLNYFWLTVDIDPTAPLFTELDAQFVGLNIGTTRYVPSITDPMGYWLVWYDYCDSYATSQYDTYCSAVAIGSWANYSPSLTGAQYENYVYENYADPSTRLQLYPGQTYDITIVKDDDNQSFFYSGEVAAYIDWNQDGDFDDSGEQIFWTAHSSSSTGPIVLTGTFTVPSDVSPGLTGMRILVYENAINTACHIGTWGETEDYLIEIVGLEIVGDGLFGTVGQEARRVVTVRNPSSVDLVVSGFSATSAAFAAFQPGTYTPVSAPVTIPAGSEISAEIAFGNRVWTPAGAAAGTATINYQTTDGSYTFPPLQFPLDGYYASLEAYQGGTDLLAPDAFFDLGGADLGATQPLQAFLTLQPDQYPVDPLAPIDIDSWWIDGPDAALFNVTGMPPVITGQVSVLVTMQTAGISAGPKQAFLHIQHSAANGPTITIELRGRIGNPVLSAPTVVYTPPLARGYQYTVPFENVGFIPLTVPEAIPVEMYGTPTLAGVGANRFELLGNAGQYYLRGQYDAMGNVVPAGSLTDPTNWKAATPTDPVVVTATQPWLLVVRMRYAPPTTPIGTYNAEIALTGNISNAYNQVIVTVVGQLVNDPTILELYPPQLSFGTVPVGNRLVKRVTLRNQSGVAGTAHLMLSGSDYHFGNGQQTLDVNLPASNDPVTVAIYFEPIGVGQRSGQLSASGVINGTIPLDGTGVAANPDQILFSVDGNTLPPNGTIDFGTVTVGQIGSKPLVIANNSVAPIQITGVARAGNNPTQFAIPFNGPVTIGPNGGTASIDVQFVPTNVSPPQKQAQLVVYISNGVQTFSYAFNLQGQASYQTGGGPILTITPSPYDYGNQSATQTFTVTNHGGSPQSLSYAVILGSPNFTLVNSPSFPQTLAANGGTLQLDVAFDAQSGTNGRRSATLLVIAPGVNPYPTATLRGTVGQYTANASTVETVVAADRLQLLPLAPNPVADESVLIRYRVVEPVTAVQIQLFNAAGQVVARLQGSGQVGEHQQRLDLRALPAGQYTVRLYADGTVLNATLLLLK